MRQVGSFQDGKSANLFADYLESIGVRSQADDDNGTWTVWVRDENQVDQARSELSEFETKPHDAKYQSAVDKAKVIRQQQLNKRIQAAKNTVEMRKQWNRPTASQCPLTMGLIGACVLLALATSFGDDQTGTIMRTLGFCDLPIYIESGDPLLQMRQGQIWRAFTPALLHGSPGHLLFNMLWLYSLGIPIESRKKTLFFGILVLVCGVGSNFLQFIISGNPNMIGISGVVYGLFGFIWAKQMFDPRCGFRMPESTILIMMVCLVLGFTGALDRLAGSGIANWAHLGGLVIGMAAAFIPLAFSPPSAR